MSNRITLPTLQLTADSLGTVLDKLVVAQFELCGLDPHPTRASLSEARFREAREALAAGIASLKELMAEDTSSSANGASFSQRDNDFRAAA